MKNVVLQFAGLVFEIKYLKAFAEKNFRVFFFSCSRPANFSLALDFFQGRNAHILNEKRTFYKIFNDFERVPVLKRFTTYS